MNAPSTCTTSCKLCGSDASPGSGIQLGSGWTEGWSTPYLLCYPCVAKEHGVEIRPSQILPEEFGLFAVKVFQEKDFIVPYCGEKVSIKQLIARYQVNSSPCGAFLKKGYTVDAPDRYLHGLGRYANDKKPFSTDEENNAIMDNFVVGPPDNPDLIIWPGLYARELIQPGTEITISYGRKYWTVWEPHLKKTS